MLVANAVPHIQASAILQCEAQVTLLFENKNLKIMSYIMHISDQKEYILLTENIKQN